MAPQSTSPANGCQNQIKVFTAFYNPSPKPLPSYLNLILDFCLILPSGSLSSFLLSLQFYNEEIGQSRLEGSFLPSIGSVLLMPDQVGRNSCRRETQTSLSSIFLGYKRFTVSDSSSRSAQGSSSS
ncbi:hypothetical protein XENORESO_021855 [Xenotaenia resolanae]|uniref:Uncharacterized protein n=1 Tax=Xenotaenia resolanae TaxID=208358 RepID=A0ABV0WHL0_9TELE